MNSMRIAILSAIILSWIDCFSQPTEKSLRESEFFDMYRRISKSQYDSVYIYDVNVTKKGRVRDSILIATCPLLFDTSSYWIYSYDKLNREIQRFEVINGQRILNAEKVYNNSGQLAEWIWYNTDGKIHSKTFYEYDSARKLTLSNKFSGYWYLKQPNLETKIEYSYSDGHLAEKREYYYDNILDNSLSVMWTRKFDTQGNEIYYKEEWGKYLWFTISEYDEKNQLIRETIDGNERKKSIMEYTYSSEGLPVEVYWYFPGKQNKKIIRVTRYYYT